MKESTLELIILLLVPISLWMTIPNYVEMITSPPTPELRN